MSYSAQRWFQLPALESTVDSFRDISQDGEVPRPTPEAAFQGMHYYLCRSFGSSIYYFIHRGGRGMEQFRKRILILA